MLPAGVRPLTSDVVYLDGRNWRAKAACGAAKPSAFFSPDGERGAARARREARARRICQTCPVLAECREYALAAAEPFGTWGGMTEADRRQYARLMRRYRRRPNRRSQLLSVTAEM
ncbi:WhiB family transcriptional regulator [Rhodococcus wratislaviensis]|uniref:WhiB family transcriptional regulator n=1 Tax=Rhodococcus wratislaviensis TaxID=44752 RepID=UPI0009DEDB26|nr:WhiB family transcriptional regulator [Rhodococcus wratislaviensis]